MLPEKLIIEAFGPYRDRQVVDFTLFSDRFLIWGETGAGKTALLDAMTCALYGKASSAERGGIYELRCQMSDPQAETLVDFIFSVGGRRYRFWRRLRPLRRRKKEPEDDVRKNYALECGALALEETGEERNLAENAKPTAQEEAANRVIGMGYSQFVQIMVLPQGKFERFLTAESAEKEQILRNIFRTDRFNAYQEKLAALYRKRDTALREREQQVAGRWSAYQVSSAEELRAQIEGDRVTLAREETQEQAARQAYEQCSGEAQRAQKLSEAFDRTDAADKRLNLLLEREQKMRDAALRVDAAERALEVCPRDAAWQDVKSRLARAEQSLVQAEQDTLAAQQAAEAAAQKLAALEQEKSQAEAMAAEREELSACLPELIELAAAKETQKTALRLLPPAQRAFDQLGEQVRRDAERLRALREEMRGLDEQYRSRLPQLQSRCDEWSFARQKKEQLEKLTEELQRVQAERKALEKQREERREAAQMREQEEMQRSEEYFSNAAAELSKRLTDGKPCPVCGSIHHPNPGISKGYGSARERFIQARRAYKEAREAQDKASAAAQGALERENVLLRQRDAARLEAEKLPYDAQAEHSAQQSLKIAQEQSEKWESLQREAVELEKNAPIMETKLENARQGLEERQRENDRAAARVLECEKRVGDETRPAEEIQMRIRAIRDALEKREKALTAAQQADQTARRDEALAAQRRTEAEKQRRALTEEEIAARKALDDELVRCGFETEEAYRGALMEREDAAALRGQVQTYNQSLHAAQEEANAAAEAVAGQQRPELQSALDRQAESLARLNEAAAACGAQRALIARKEKLLDENEEESKKLAEERRAADKMHAFVDCFAVNKGLTLSSFVLQAMLGAVAEQANRLLEMVHGGRYRLSIREGGVQNKLDGLELSVQDAYSGGERAVRTLSGGEKFLVSLALSLGLSSVVRAQAGGVRMEAMFIDEGFGTLDPRSIQDALDVLSCIGSGGQVGIISHVDALRETIAQGIEVKKGEHGSRIVQVV